MALIELKNVWKGFGNQEVLRGINLTIQEEETVIILGGSGQGKSTILRLILRLDEPDEGEILVNNLNITSLKEEELVPVRKWMGMVFQESSLFDSLTVYDNIAYRMREEGKLSEEEIFEKTKHLLQMVDLKEEDAFKVPSELSGGMKRRVAIARGMAGDHRIMLYDEPTAGLDPITASHITEFIIRLRDMEEVTSIIVTQDLISSFQMVTHCAHKTSTGIQVKPSSDHTCTKKTRLVILKDGQILAEGDWQKLLNSTDPYVQKFLSSLKILASH